jgi:hypothetical protein
VEFMLLACGRWNANIASHDLAVTYGISSNSMERDIFVVMMPIMDPEHLGDVQP